MIGIRGAIAEVSDTSEDIIESTKKLFTEILKINNSLVDSIISSEVSDTSAIAPRIPIIFLAYYKKERT